jgi:hypothetical protein
MHVSKILANQLGSALLLFGFAAVPVFASGIVSCPPVPATTSDFITPYVGAGNGCSAPDGTFQDFSVGDAYNQTINGTTFGSSGTVPDVTSGQIFLTTGPSNPKSIEIFSPGPNYYPGGPNPGHNFPTNYCHGDTGSEGWCVNGADQYLTSQITFQSVFNFPVTEFGFSGAAYGSTFGKPTALLFLEVCPGTLTFSQGCPGYQVLEAGINNSNIGSVSFGIVALFAATNEVASRETVLLSTVNDKSDSWAAMGNLDLIDAPEPATMVLTASVLLMLGLIRLRKTA